MPESGIMQRVRLSPDVDMYMESFMSKQSKVVRILLRKHPAFSLVEVAVTLVIMGLLVGAVLKGKDLIHTARLNGLISQIQQYKLATHSFMDRYGALPGNFAHASTQIQSSLANGDNSGFIRGPGAAPRSAGQDYQATAFWAHLAAADLISDPGSLNHNATVAPNKGFPGTKIGGGITVAHNPEPGLKGHWFIIGRHYGNTTKGGLFTPRDALAIMQKLDTPTPHHGSVQVRNAKDSQYKDVCVKGHNLNIESSSPVCVLYIQF